MPLSDNVSPTKDDGKRQRKFKMQWVRLSNTSPSPLGQRDFRPARANALAADFQLEAFGIPCLSHRDGHYYIVDGQHRIAAAKIFGFGEDQFQCEVYEGLTPEEEAELFLERNNTLTVSPFDKFRAAVHAQRPQELAIYNVVTSLGMTLIGNRTRGRSENAIGAVVALVHIHNRIGTEGLRRTLVTLHKAFGGAGLEAPLLEGLSLVLHRYNGQVDDEQMLDRLSKTSGGVNGIIQPMQKLKASMGQPLIQCAAAAIVAAYNRERAGKKLPAWWRE